MKTTFTKAIFLWLFTLLYTTISAQQFTLLASDSTNDHGIGPDLKSFSYGIDVGEDSIWFKIKTHNAINTNDGFMIGLDTNQNTTDGGIWLIGSNRTSRNYDHALFITYDLNTATQLEVRLGRVAINTKIIATVSLIDTNELIVGTSLSLLGGDKKINLLVGAAAADVYFTGATIDQLPEEDYLTINLNTTSISTKNVAPLNFYPNPASNFLYWNVHSINGVEGIIRVFNSTGVELARADLKEGKVDISRLKEGVYYIAYKSSFFKFVRV